MVPRVKDNYPLGTEKTVSLDFEEELAREGRQGNFKFSKLITFNNLKVAAVIWLKYC